MSVAVRPVATVEARSAEAVEQPASAKAIVTPRRTDGFIFKTIVFVDEA